LGNRPLNSVGRVRCGVRGFAENARDAQIFLVGLPLLAFSFILPLLEEWGIGRSWHGVISAAGHRLSHRHLLGPAGLRAGDLATAQAHGRQIRGAAVVLTPCLGIMGDGVAEIVAAFAALIAVAGARHLLGPLRATLPILVSAAIVAGFAWLYIASVALVPLSRRLRQFVTHSIAELRALRSGRRTKS
jgi:hypothetical protein